MVTDGKGKEKKNAIVFLQLCKTYGIQEPMQEVKVTEKRRFRFDFAWMNEKLAVEIEGGIWIQGRHTRGVGYVKDMEKYNLAAEAGWRVLRFTPQQIKKEETYKIIQNCLEQIACKLKD